MDVPGGARRNQQTQDNSGNPSSVAGDRRRTQSSDSPRSGYSPRSGNGAQGSSGTRKPRTDRQHSSRDNTARDTKTVGSSQLFIPEDVTFAELDRAAREQLRALSKDNAQGVGRHLVMAGRHLDNDPELAYQHAQAAMRRAGRVDIVREALALTAYRTGRYAEALREFRTVRRLNGSSEHLALMADCERGLKRPERAIELASAPEASMLTTSQRIELAIVVSGARSDLGEWDAALAALPTVSDSHPFAVRIAHARIEVLQLAGRHGEAKHLMERYPEEEERWWDEDIVVYDLTEDEEYASPDGASPEDVHQSHGEHRSASDLDG